MQEHAMSISKASKAITLGICASILTAPGAAYAQMREEEPDAMDVARTPLEDFNIDSKDIPQVLQIAVENPYDTQGLTDCNQIVAQIAVLDNVLGADFDIAKEEERRRISTGRVAKSVVGSLIPFRGIVREVSGANKKRNEARLAYTAGMVRRGYLKGLGEARGCAYPARPRLNDSLLQSTATSNVPANLPRGEQEEVNRDLVPLSQQADAQEYSPRTDIDAPE